MTTLDGDAPRTDGPVSEDAIATLARRFLHDGHSVPTPPADHVSPSVLSASATASPMVWPGPGADVVHRLRGGLGPAPTPAPARPPLRSRPIPASATLDPSSLRHDFPALDQRVHGKPLVWLDNAATTQKPQSVIDAVSAFYERDNSNVHRGAHTLAARATDAYEAAREKVRYLVGATDTAECIFVRGTTEAINLVAQSYGRSVVGPGDEIVVTELEHHSNIVPWQLLAAERGATVRVAPIDDDGGIDLEGFARVLGPRTRIVAVAQVSNALGTIVPVEVMARMAHSVGARVVVDGAQGVPHMPVNVHTLGADFYAFSGHKVFGPTGIGVLWGRRELLEEMPPWQGGGQMIKKVTFDSLPTWNVLPYKFEAGTGTIADAVGLGAAVDYLSAVGPEAVAAHEHALVEHAMGALRSIPGVRLIGTAPAKAAVVSFVVDNVPVEEAGKALDREGIAVRAGHHCAQPALRHFGLEATVRASLALYNTHEDIDALAEAVTRLARRGKGGSAWL